MPAAKLGGFAIVLICVLAIGILIGQRGCNSATTPLPSETSNPGIPRQNEPTTAPVSGAIPVYVRQVLNEIKSHNGDAPDGYRGGTTYYNDGRGDTEVLPRKDESGKQINYREYDVHPYERGVNRGAERIIRGSDGHSYFTSDHYRTFIRIE